MQLKEVVMTDKRYYYKDKPYRIFSETKVKIDGNWIDSVIYQCLYDNPDGIFWVRTAEEFDRLFKLKK